MTAYDGAYVTLAQALSAPLITRDRKSRWCEGVSVMHERYLTPPRLALQTSLHHKAAVNSECSVRDVEFPEFQLP